MQAKPHCRSCSSELTPSKRNFWRCQNHKCFRFDRPVYLGVTHAVRHGIPANRMTALSDAYEKMVRGALEGEE